MRHDLTFYELDLLITYLAENHDSFLSHAESFDDYDKSDVDRLTTKLKELWGELL